jgi:hypothetical protein
VEGVLPTIDDSGRPGWGDQEDAPPPGVTYSLTGTKFAEYFVWGELPSDRNMHSGVRLPKRVVARAFDLFSR